jgi:hypothetical protein
MIVSQDILEKQFDEFVNFIYKESGEKFETFATSKYLEKHENYKNRVCDEARDKLANKSWKTEDIGTGKIQEKVSSAINTKTNNNLINWRQIDVFAKKTMDEKLEATFYKFYKSNTIKDSEAFDLFMKEGLTYQFIAYLFFIKDRQKYLPISQEKFDEIFKQIVRLDFKTWGNASWENYNDFCNIIKQVQQFLKTKDKDATLLDAHSFLWILGYPIASKHNKSQNQQDKEELGFVEEANDLNTITDVANKEVSGDISDESEISVFVEQVDSTDILTDIANKENIINSLPEKEREIYTKARIGQGKFREELINHWQGCSVTEYQNIGILIASHIKPWRDCDAKEATDMWNGLLLIPNLDKLFDKGFISFDNEGIIMFSPQLSLNDVELLGVKKDMFLHHISSQHQTYIEYHRDKIFRKTS